MAEVSIDFALRYAATNRVWVVANYNGVDHMIFPYSFRTSKAGNHLLYAHCAKDNACECFRMDRIVHAKATTERINFSPEFPVEIESSDYLDTNLDKAKQPMQQQQQGPVQTQSPFTQQEPVQPINPVSPVPMESEVDNTQKPTPAMPIGKPTVETVVPLQPLQELPQAPKGIPNV